MPICSIRNVIIVLSCLFMSGCLIPQTNEEVINLTPDQDMVDHTLQPSGNQLADLMQCNLPCWVGITPGETDRDDAIALLEKRYGNNHISVTSNFIEWTSGNADISEGGAISLLNDTVDDLYVWFAENTLMINDLIQFIGEPDRVIAMRAVSSQGGCAGASLFYSVEGIDVSLYPSNGLIGVYETQSIHSLFFLSPRLSSLWNPTDSIITNWDGFRDYCRE